MNTRRVQRQAADGVSGQGLILSEKRVHAGEVKAAKMIRELIDSFGVKNRMEEFDFWGFSDQQSCA